MAARAAALRDHLRVPMFRSGYALVANEGVTAALGLVYWLVAARQYDARTVGINTAAISAMMFIAGVAQLNLMSALLRFVPVLGAARRRFIAVCYAVAARVQLSRHSHRHRPHLHVENVDGRAADRPADWNRGSQRLGRDDANAGVLLLKLCGQPPRRRGRRP